MQKITKKYVKILASLSNTPWSNKAAWSFQLFQIHRAATPTFFGRASQKFLGAFWTSNFHILSNQILPCCVKKRCLARLICIDMQPTLLHGYIGCPQSCGSFSQPVWSLNFSSQGQMMSIAFFERKICHLLDATGLSYGRSKKKKSCMSQWGLGVCFIGMFVSHRRRRLLRLQLRLLRLRFRRSCEKRNGSNGRFKIC